MMSDAPETNRRVKIAHSRARYKAPPVARLTEETLTDGSKGYNVEVLGPDGEKLATIACYGFTHAIDVRNAILENAAYAT